MDRFPPTSSRCGSEDITNPYRHRTHETSFGGDISEITPLIGHSTVEEQREKAWEVLEREYPNVSASLRIIEFLFVALQRLSLSHTVTTVKS